MIKDVALKSTTGRREQKGEDSQFSYSHSARESDVLKRKYPSGTIKGHIYSSIYAENALMVRLEHRKNETINSGRREQVVELLQYESKPIK